MDSPIRRSRGSNTDSGKGILQASVGALALGMLSVSAASADIISDCVAAKKKCEFHVSASLHENGKTFLVNAGERFSVGLPVDLAGEVKWSIMGEPERAVMGLTRTYFTPLVNVLEEDRLKRFQHFVFKNHKEDRTDVRHENKLKINSLCSHYDTRREVV